MNDGFMYRHRTQTYQTKLICHTIVPSAKYDHPKPSPSPSHPIPSHRRVVSKLTFQNHTSSASWLKPLRSSDFIIATILSHTHTHHMPCRLSQVNETILIATPSTKSQEALTSTRQSIMRAVISLAMEFTLHYNDKTSVRTHLLVYVISAPEKKTGAKIID